MELPLVVDAVDYGTLEGGQFFFRHLPPFFFLLPLFKNGGGVQAPLDLPLDPPLLEAEKLPLRPYALLAGAPFVPMPFSPAQRARKFSNAKGARFMEQHHLYATHVRLMTI